MNKPLKEGKKKQSKSSFKFTLSQDGYVTILIKTQDICTASTEHSMFEYLVVIYGRTTLNTPDLVWILGWSWSVLVSTQESNSHLLKSPLFLISHINKYSKSLPRERSRIIYKLEAWYWKRDKDIFKSLLPAQCTTLALFLNLKKDENSEWLPKQCYVKLLIFWKVA